MTTALETLQNFDLENSTVTLWAFKKSYDKNQREIPKYSGSWIETSDKLDEELKQAISNARDQISESLEYALLAQNNEESVLTIPSIETNAGLIVAQATSETDAKKASKIAKIHNSNFYSIKITNADNVIHCVRKTDDSWKTKKSSGLIATLFSDEGLDIEEKESFSISKYFDFFIVNETILIQNKQQFESILHYKAAHIQDLSSLLSENEFSSIFSDIEHLVDYIGSNKIKLRRMSAVKEKQYYKNQSFLQSLRDSHTEFGLSIEFDETGRIKVTPDSCQDILLALLDHRLKSHFSQNIYDVQHTVTVSSAI